MAFADYWNELTKSVPKLSAVLAQTLINRGWRDIIDARLWSWLVADGNLASPSLINSGTVSVTTGIKSVVANSVAKALLDAAISDPLNPLAYRQFRLPYGPVYNIASYDSLTGTITLDRVYTEVPNATASFLVYRCYYRPPSTDFIRFMAVIDPLNGYPLNLRRYQTKAHLDRVDPQRGSQGQAYYVANYGLDPLLNVPMFEFWPHPTVVQTFQCWYQRKGLDLSDTNDLPPSIPVDLLMMRGRYRAYEWAMANQGAFPELRGVNWSYLMSTLDESRRGRGVANSYTTALQRAKKIDEEIMVRNVIIPARARGFAFPIDAAFIQSHDVDRM